MVTKKAFIDSISQPLFDPKGEEEVFAVYLIVEDESSSIWQDSKRKKYIYGRLDKTKYLIKNNEALEFCRSKYDKTLASLKEEMWQVALKEMFPHSLKKFNIWRIEPLRST